MSPTQVSSQLSRRARSLRASSTLAVTSRVNRLKAQGADIVGFGAGQPDFDTPENIKQAAVEALAAGHTRYTATPGPMEVREVISRKLRDENDIDCKAEHVVITVGAKQSLFMTMQCIVDPGQEVIIPTPAWVSYRPMVELAGGVVREVPGAIENDFKISPEQLDDALNDQTAAVIFNSPSNPCGTMYRENDFRALADVLSRYPHVTVVTDEIYEKLVFGSIKHFSPGSIPELAERTITINGLSKSYAMTGWRIGYLCAPGASGRGEVARAVSRLQDQLTSNITAFCYPAITEALERSATAVEHMRQTFAGRAQRMFEQVSAIPDLMCPRPTGAFYLFPDVGAYLGRETAGGQVVSTASDFAEALLEEAGVAVVPGEDFGECARTHIRLSFACSDEQIDEGCRRIRGFLERMGV